MDSKVYRRASIASALRIQSPLGEWWVPQARWRHHWFTRKSRRFRWWNLARGCLSFSWVSLLRLRNSSLTLPQTVKHIPTWFPGAGFKRNAIKWKAMVEEFVDKPYEWTKSDIVRVNSLYFLLPITCSLVPYTRKMVLPYHPFVQLSLNRNLDPQTYRMNPTSNGPRTRCIQVCYICIPVKKHTNMITKGSMDTVRHIHWVSLHDLTFQVSFNSDDNFNDPIYSFHDEKSSGSRQSPRGNRQGHWKRSSTYHSRSPRLALHWVHNERINTLGSCTPVEWVLRLLAQLWKSMLTIVIYRSPSSIDRRQYL